MFTHIGTPVDLPNLKARTTPKGRHYTTPNGLIYPSVTTILGQTQEELKREKLNNWRNMLGPEKAAKETKRCADRGSAVHDLIERYLNNEEDFTKGVNPEYIKRFNQLKFRLNRIDQIRTQEAALYSNKLKIAGRVDCIGEYDGTLSIIDFKTSTNDKDRDKVEDYFLQCAAYAIMWMELTGEAINNIAILMTVEKGLVPLVFTDTVDKYVKPLLKRVHEYHGAH